MNSPVQLCILIALTQFSILSVSASPDNWSQTRYTTSWSPPTPPPSSFESWNEWYKTLFESSDILQVEDVDATLLRMSEFEDTEEFKQAFREEEPGASLLLLVPQYASSPLISYIRMIIVAKEEEHMEVNDGKLTDLLRNTLNTSKYNRKSELLTDIEKLCQVTQTGTTINQVLKNFLDVRISMCWEHYMSCFDKVFQKEDSNLQNIASWQQTIPANIPITIDWMLYKKDQVQGMEEEALYYVEHLATYLDGIRNEQSIEAKFAELVSEPCRKLLKKSRFIIKNFIAFGEILKTKKDYMKDNLKIRCLRVCQVVIACKGLCYKIHTQSRLARNPPCWYERHQ